MQFVTVRELRSHSADLWKRLAVEPDMVITSNGKPVAILSAVSPDGLEESLTALRRTRAVAAVDAMQRQSVVANKQGTSQAVIQTEIQAYRKGRAK